jgi:BlaI family penicillinase repressor
MTRLTRLELRVMEALWELGASSVRELRESFPEKGRPAYTTVQTIVYRLEAKKAVRRLKRVGNAHVFGAVLSRNLAQRRLMEDFLAAFGGRAQPLVARLIEAGKLTLEDVREAERLLESLGKGKDGA